MTKISDKLAYHVSKWPLAEINELIESLLVVSFMKSYEESEAFKNSWAQQYWSSSVMGSK